MPGTSKKYTDAKGDVSDKKHDAGWTIIDETVKICHSYTKIDIKIPLLTLLLLNTSYPVVANSTDPDQLASEETN